MVVPQQAAEMFPALNLAIRTTNLIAWIDDCIAKPLVISFFVIMQKKRSCGST